MTTTTTMEHLLDRVSASYGSVLKYGEYVLVTDIHWKGYFTAEIYEFIETPEETGLGEIECRVNLIATAEETFEDSGHAIAWAIQKITNR